MNVYLSYSSEDNALAKKVAEFLQLAGVTIWNHDDIMPGENWAKKIGEALEESEAMVVLITPNSLRSSWVQREIEYALSEKNFNQRLIPVLVGSEEDLPLNKLSWILRHLQVIKLPVHGAQDQVIDKITEAFQAVA